MGKLYDALPDIFLKKVLEGEDPELQEQLLEHLYKYQTNTDKEEKNVWKERLSSSYQRLYQSVCTRLTPQSSKHKRLLVRFGLLDMRLLSEETQKTLLSIPFENTDQEAPEETYYVDEWLLAVAKGSIKTSAADETKGKANAKPHLAHTKVSQLEGLLQAEMAVYESKVQIQQAKMKELASLYSEITQPQARPSELHLSMSPLNQDTALDTMFTLLRTIKHVDKELQTSFTVLSKKQKELNALKANAEQKTLSPTNMEDLKAESGAIAQMIKMTVGRQGNPFPILTEDIVSSYLTNLLTRTSLRQRIKKIESLDPNIFMRTFKQQETRIPPYILLVPGYGTTGICWEPYDKYNKISGRGRVVLPIFSKQADLSLILGLGDFRWQVAREMASFRWMEEGLTGRFYQYTQEQRLKGDVRNLFVADYIIWLTKESQGTAKLHKDSRYVFWRFAPFPDTLKETLSKKGFYYAQLWEGEQSFRAHQSY